MTPWLPLCLLLAVAAVGATCCSAAAVVRFPLPATDSLGRLRLLPSLQCETTAPGCVGGIRGFVLPAPAKGGPPVAIPIGSAVFWSPMTDDPALASASAARPGRGGPYVSVVLAASQVKPHYRNGVAAFRSLRTAMPTGRPVRVVIWTPFPPNSVKWGGGGDGNLLREAAAVRLLAVQRNSLAGALHRVLATYDVVAFRWMTMGFCRTPDCANRSAGDVLGSGPAELYSKSTVPLLLYTPTEGTTADPSLRRHVGMDDVDFLSLARAVLADPEWLPAAVASSWRLRAWLSVQVGYQIDVDGIGTTTANVLNPNQGWGRPVDLGNTSDANAAQTSKWLQAVSHTLCSIPRASFLAAAQITHLCGPSRGELSVGPYINGALVTRAHRALWSFDPDRHDGDRAKVPPQPAPAPTEGLPLCNLSSDRDVVHTGRPVTRLAWLVGRADREIKPAASGEVALAHSISTCAYRADLGEHN